MTADGIANSSPVKRSPLQRPKGTQDIFLSQADHWRQVEATMMAHFRQAGYQEIRTPILESTQLFERGVGQETDIVNKEMYSFEKGEHQFTLRPEGTAGVVRAFIEQGLHRQAKPLKLFYLGPMFRYERPQAGRQRQFHQFGVEVFGSSSPAVDAEVIFLAWTLFQKLGVPNLSLEINDIGSAAARKTFQQDFKRLLSPQLSQLCEACQKRFETNPFRMLDCKNPSCQPIYEQPAVRDLLASPWTEPESQTHYQALTAILSDLGIPYRRNEKLVRGLDYYNNTVFEITSGELGAQNAVCGGGRYDALVETLGGPETPAVGWALGIERLIQLVPEASPLPLDYTILTHSAVHGFRLAAALREKGYQVVVDLSGKAFGKQLEAAAKKQSRFVIFLGDAEIESQQVRIKNLTTGEEITQDLMSID